VADCFVLTEPDEVNERFLQAALAAPHGAWKTFLHGVGCKLLGDFDVNGVLNMYPVHLLSAAQWQRLLPAQAVSGTHLDVGAGNGDLTVELRDHFQATSVTEASWAMRRRLRAQGYTVYPPELSHVPGFGDFATVTCLNVLDRTARPLTLLSHLHAAAKARGFVVVAAPLPLRPFYYRGPLTAEPKEPIQARGPRWENAAIQLLQLIQRAQPGWQLCAWTRVPYLSWGDADCSLYALDDVVLVFRKTG
jgi:hypothetical protein